MSVGRTICVAVVGLTVIVSAAQAASKRVLVFGDSITWGWVPTDKGVPTERFPNADQWPTVMKEKFGPDYDIEVDALSGRTTDVDDPSAPMPGAALNGAAYLPAALAAHMPVDLVVIMLGTNDTKAVFKRSPFQIALGAGHLISIVQSSANMFGGGWYSYGAPKVLLIAPPPMGTQNVFSAVFEGNVGVERSQGLAAAYGAVAKAAGAFFFDSGSVIKTDGVDGVHLTAASERALGAAVADQVKAALQ